MASVRPVMRTMPSPASTIVPTFSALASTAASAICFFSASMMNSLVAISDEGLFQAVEAPFDGGVEQDVVVADDRAGDERGIGVPAHLDVGVQGFLEGRGQALLAVVGELLGGGHVDLAHAL